MSKYNVEVLSNVDDDNEQYTREATDTAAVEAESEEQALATVNAELDLLAAEVSDKADPSAKAECTEVTE